MRALSVVALAACGRVDFDAIVDAAVPDAVPADPSLVFYYPTDGSYLLDQSGQGHDGSCARDELRIYNRALGDAEVASFATR